MIDVDSVYQKVLALSNKEQRGYITPQEFNLMADKAQKEIFDNYFHDIKTSHQKPKTPESYSDEKDLAIEKLAPFRAATTVSVGTNGEFGAIPSNLYKIRDLHSNRKSLEYLDEDDFRRALSHPLSSPTSDRRVFYLSSVNATSGLPQIFIDPAPTVATDFTLTYFRTPHSPKWGYVVVNNKALYNNNTTHTTHFELHPSEEEILVARILQLAGIIIMKPGIVEIGSKDKANIKAEQNN